MPTGGQTQEVSVREDAPSATKPLLRSAYFKVLIAAAIAAVCLLVMIPSAQAQEDPCTVATSAAYCLDKTASPDPAKLGKPLTFTITGHCAPGSPCVFAPAYGIVDVMDTLPPGVSFVSATASGLIPAACSDSAGTVTCGPEFFNTATPYVETITLIPTRCGSYTNTAVDTNNAATASFTVRCPAKHKRHHKHNNHHRHH